MSKIDTIYNFRIEVEDEFYNPQYNHPSHGWVNLRTTSLSTSKKGEYSNLNIYCDISGQNEYIEIKKKDLALTIIEEYKKIVGLENIKKEYIYVE